MQPDGSVLLGEVVIEGDTITCVAADCPDPPGATLFVISDAYIFPGFIDAHNHVAYNFLPKWSPPKLFAHRGLWQSAPSYKAFKAPYDAGLKHIYVRDGALWGDRCVDQRHHQCARDAQSALQQGPGAEHREPERSSHPFARSHPYSPSFPSRSFQDTIDFTKTRSFVPHIAEGIGETPRKEFDVLKAKGLLRSETAIIHGTAFGDAEFAEMGQVGAELIWCPPIQPRPLRAHHPNPPRAETRGRGVAGSGMEPQWE